MKALFCRNCGDLKMLLPNRRRHCFCKLSFGRYLKNGKARYGGPAMLVGIDQPEIEMWRGPFVDTPQYVIHRAFAIPETASTVEYVG